MAPRRGRWPGWTAVPAGGFRNFARLWFNTRPAVLRVGYGLQRHTNGGAIVRGICMLPALTGHWRDRGGGFLLSNSGSYGFDALARERPDPAGTDGTIRQ